jgi:hypothetical protein
VQSTHSISQVPSLAESDGLSVIRIVRILRPLRTLTKVEGMRKLVITLLQSMPMLMDVGVLLSFAFFIFGIVGVQVRESLHTVCV